MPNAEIIVERLTRAAETFPMLAMAWHAAIAVGLSFLVAGAWRPSRRLAAGLLTLLLLSVSAVSFRMGDAFNGSTFGVLTALSALLATRMSCDPADRAAPWSAALAGILLGYAWVYPHFLPDGTWWQAALLAPVGVLPCPTLIAVLAFALLTHGLGSRTWLSLLAGAGLLYGALGVFWLGVWLDLGLLIAALIALSLAAFAGQPAAPARPDADQELSRIRAFLATERMALIGVSTHSNHFSRVVMRALLDRGLRVIPVHPSADVLEGARVYARVTDIAPPVRAALIMTPAHVSERVVEECARAGVERVWLHRGVGAGAVSDAALQSAHQHQLELIAGRCPLMFLDDPASGVHRAHAMLLQLAGHYPRTASRPFDEGCS